MRTAFLIDGFNFYHSIEKLPKKIRWFDYRAYCQHFLRKNETLHSITYFTALATWRSNDSVMRHQAFIAANEENGIKTVLGKFKEKDWRCQHCGLPGKRHEEKATDVNIALHAYRLAASKEIDQLFLVTGDTDLVPAIRMIKSDFPDIEIGVVFPFHRETEELKKEVSRYHSTKKKILEKFQLPDVIYKRQNNKQITRPPEWA